MGISTPNGRRGRRNSKNLDGGQASRVIVDTELTVVVASKHPHGSVTHHDSGVTKTPRNPPQDRTDPRNNLYWSQSRRRVADAELAVVVSSECTY